MKEIIKRLLIAMVSLLLSVEVFAYDFKVDGIYYGFVSNNPNGVYVTYKDTNYNSYMGDVKIPPTVEYNGTTYTVTVIGSKAFYNCEYMTSIDIPYTIKKISSNAFNALNHLDQVNITDLSAYCQIKFESYPLKDGAGLYLNGEIVDTIKGLDETCTKISAGAFYGYKHLLSAIIPESVTTLEEDVFYECSKLQYFEAGSNVETIGEAVFRGCTSLTKIKFVDGEKPLKLGRWTFNYNGGAFKDCPLEEVYIGRNIDFEYVGYNSDSFLPFPNRIAKAIFNKYAGGTAGSHYMYGFASIGEAYFTPDCEKIVFPYESKKSPGTIYIFSNKITKIQNSEMGSTGTYRSFDKIYVIDKENLPEAFSSVKGDYYNLVDLTNVENGFTCEYGSTELPLHNIEFTNNVESMDVNIKMDSINLNAGFHNEGLPISFTNDLWNCVINYPLEYTITKAPLTIIANDVQRKYGEENPELTCSYFGFKNNENEDVLTQKAQLVTNAVASSNVGTYSIIPINAEAQNYSMVYERGTLTITQADQTITWDDDVYYAEVGEQIELTAISTSGLEIKYEVSDESLAEIYRSGGKQFIDCLKSGEVTIKAYQDGNENFKPADRLTKKLIIKDKVVQAENISLSKSSISLRMGESYKLTATIYPENATSKEVVWKSSNENIVAISNTGVVTALEEGTTTIVATTVDGSNLSAVCDVMVQPTLAESLILDKSEVTLNVNEEIILVATITPTSIPNNELRWTSSNDAIATVDKDGIVTAIATGEAIITVATTDGSNLSASCKVTVVPTLVESITLDKTEINLEATQTAELTATVLPELANNKVVTWKSSDKSAAIVDANGVVTAIAVGEAIITATTTDGTNLSATCKVTVVPTLATSITLDKAEISLEATERATLIASVLPELATDKSVKWSSSNESVTIVDANGVVTAISVGEAIITAATTDGSNLTASCKVIVIPTFAVSIELDQTEASVEEKSDLQLIATILPEHTTNKEVAWSSSDKWVASVDNYGLVTMYSAGEVIITAATTDGTNLSATCRINVYSGIDGVNGDAVIVATVGDNIVVKNAQLGSVVNVYASNGALVASEEATDGSVVVEAPVKGVYVVKVGKQTVKVII